MSVPRRTVTVVLLVAPVGAVTCTREADLPDPPSTIAVPTSSGPTVVDAGTLDVGLGSGSCVERPEGDCRGSNDFPCELGRWVDDVAARCQRETGCGTNGWVRVVTSEQGCVAELGMSEPSAPFAACMAGALSASRCPCGAIEHRTFLGDGHGDAGCPEGGPLR